MTPEDLATNLRDPVWRLGNLYKVRREDTGELVGFRPRPQQREIIDRVYRRGQRSLMILKSRRLGISTVNDILLGDACTFNAGLQASIVDQNAQDAQRKLQNIVRVALDGMPDPLQGIYHRESDSSYALELNTRGAPPSNASAIYAGLNARGGTNHLLHVSEFGPIAFYDSKRANEIITGALPSARAGVRLLESTWKGGKGGPFWGLLQAALELPIEARGPEDWEVLFFPWYDDPMCVSAPAAGHIDGETLDYLRHLEATIGRTLTDAQKTWYWKERRVQGRFMFSEYPSTLEECWSAPVEGAIYAEDMATAEEEGRVREFEVDHSKLVHTAWDLGAPEQTSTVFFQRIEGRIHIVDHVENEPWRLDQRVADFMGRGYSFGVHLLPHDATNREKSGLTFVNQLADLGIHNVAIVPKTSDIWIGINRVHQLFPRLVFRKGRTGYLREALSNYHRDKPANKDEFKPMPAHDWSSHAADAMRTLAEGEALGMLPGDRPVDPRLGPRSARAKVVGVT